MESPTISLILAVSRDNIIGRDNDTPWAHQDDLDHFRKTTIGKSIIMGRTTFKAIGKSLVGRKNIVLTRDTSVHGMAMIGTTPVYYVNNMEQALESARAYSNEIMIIGGAEIYRLFLPVASKIYLSRMDISCYREGSKHTYMDLNAELRNHYHKIDSKEYMANENNECYCTIETYVRTR